MNVILTFIRKMNTSYRIYGKKNFICQCLRFTNNRKLSNREIRMLCLFHEFAISEAKGLTEVLTVHHGEVPTVY